MNSQALPGNPALRQLSFAAIVGVVLFWAITMIHGLLLEDYSHVLYALSTLGMRGAPFAFVSRAAFILLGVSMLAFGWAVYLASRTAGFASYLAMVLVWVHSIGRIGEGVFAFDPEVPGAVGNQLHLLFGFPGVVVMLFVPFAVYWAFGTTVNPSLRRYTLVTGFLFLTAFIAGVLGPNFGLSVPLGLGQRIGFAIWYVWVLVIAYHFVQSSGTESA